MTRLRICVAFAAAFMLVASSAFAVTPDERLSDPELEAKAREITKELRCLVCQNQSIDDSDAGLAKELRVLVRERVLAGDTKSEVLDTVIGIHGEYVLLRPRWGIHTALAWMSPLILLVFGLFVARSVFRSGGQEGEQPSENVPHGSSLSEQQKQLLENLRNAGEGR